jgi:hypothetical protein
MSKWKLEEGRRRPTRNRSIAAPKKDDTKTTQDPKKKRDIAKPTKMGNISFEVQLASAEANQSETSRQDQDTSIEEMISIDVPLAASVTDSQTTEANPLNQANEHRTECDTPQTAYPSSAILEQSLTCDATTLSNDSDLKLLLSVKPAEATGTRLYDKGKNPFSQLN